MKIYGHTVSTPVSHSDWNETNERMSSYINNKPSIKKGEGDYSTVRNEASEALGRGSDASGYGTKTEGDYSHVGGVNSQIATGGYASRVDGYNNRTSAKYSNVDGAENENHAECADISGYNNYAAEGSDSVHIEGSNNRAETSPNAHIEGSSNTAEADSAHVEGTGNIAFIGAACAHVEGSNNQAMYEAICAHIEGKNNSASGKYAHVQGSHNTANAHSSSASGFHNEVAEGAGYSSVSGSYNKAIGWNQNVRGKWCYPKTAAEIVGGGTSESDRRNIYELDWQGNAMFAGDVKARGNKTLATLDDVKDAASKAVADVVGSSPTTLDTLEELGKALGEDPNFASTMVDALGKKADAKDLENYVSNKAAAYGWKVAPSQGVVLDSGVYVIRWLFSSAVVFVYESDDFDDDDGIYQVNFTRYFLCKNGSNDVCADVGNGRVKVTEMTVGDHAFKYKLLFPLQ